VSLSLRGVDADAAAAVLRGVAGVATVEHSGAGLTVLPEAGCSIALGLTGTIREAGWEVSEFHVEQGHLDDVFRTITTAAGGAT
jgi:ABC-2 type transport system ATP-binding protein